MRTAAAPAAGRTAEAGEHDGRRGGRRQAEREERHQRPRRGGVVRGLGAGDALDGTRAELSGRRATLPLERVREKGRHHRRPPAAPRAESRGPAAQPRLPRARTIRRGDIHSEPRDRPRAARVTPVKPRRRTAPPPPRTTDRDYRDAMPSRSGGISNVNRATPVSRLIPMRPSRSTSRRLSGRAAPTPPRPRRRR